jgi:D-amino peptidase
VKIFISADIEGTAGIQSWDEAERTHADHMEFRELMTGKSWLPVKEREPLAQLKS